MFFILEIMAFEFVSKCGNCNGNTCYPQYNDSSNSLKITNQTNKDFFQFNISQIHGKIR